jgi:5-methylcytosine-specific restriction protein A
MARLEFSRKTKNALIKRADGRCEACRANLKPSEGEVDHILPCELGGEPTIANGRLICRPCHKEKTANDVRSIRKSDRQRDKGNGAIKPAGAIPGRGFAQSEKSSKRAAKPPLAPRQLYQEQTT